MEDWELMRMEYYQKYPNAPQDAHSKLVRRAFNDGMPIPEEVAKDYPQVFGAPKRDFTIVPGVANDIDLSIADLVSVLNQQGYRTIQSHSGWKQEHHYRFPEDVGPGFLQFDNLDANREQRIIWAARSAGMSLARNKTILQIKMADGISDKDVPERWRLFRQFMEL
jgi:hypothetical protein